MELKNLSTAILLTTFSSTSVFAAALDRSEQSISAFLQSGNYFEAGISVLDPNVSGSLKNAEINIGEMGDDYQFYNAALKLQLPPQMSFGLLFDQPFGADATYPVEDIPLFHNGLEGTKVEVSTQSLSLLLGYQPNEKWNIYGGAAYQILNGKVALQGGAYSGNISSPSSGFAGYNIDINDDSAVGWIAGLAYQIPEIALKASVTYRSEIKHMINANETSTIAKYQINHYSNL